MRMSIFIALGISVATLAGGFVAADPAIRSDDTSSKISREEIQGGIAFRPEKRKWIRVTGKVKVLSSHLLAYDDGTQADLNGLADGPELEQRGLIGDQLYPCGQEAAEFLKRLIGNRPVTCLSTRDNVQGQTMNVASAFIGEINLNIEMVRNGWAVSDHEGSDPWEIIARENKRGLWHGKFTVPKRWRQGERLPGEPGTR